MHPTIKQSLMALFSAFPAPDNFDPEQSTLAYLMAIEELPPEHIASAVKRFIRAEVPRPAHRFLPTAAELAQEARRIRDEANYRAHLALPKPSDEARAPVSPEERERVEKQMRELTDELLRKQRERSGERRFMAGSFHLSPEDDLRITADRYASAEPITLSPAALSRVGVRTEEASQKEANA